MGLGLLRAVVRRGRLLRLGVKGFKSLRDIEVDFPVPLTVVVGPNGSGKTALVESLELLREVLEYIRGRAVSPFVKWWGYRNVVWGAGRRSPYSSS